MDAPFPPELFHFIDIFSPNESELSRLTGIATESFEQITQAVLKCHKMVSFCTPKTIIISKALFYPLSMSSLLSGNLCKEKKKVNKLQHIWTCFRSLIDPLCYLHLFPHTHSCSCACTYRQTQNLNFIIINGASGE